MSSVRVGLKRKVSESVLQVDDGREDVGMMRPTINDEDLITLELK